MKKILVLLSIFLCTSVYADTKIISAKFVRCVDGDTAVFNVNDEDIKYRFLAIDTPESVKPNTEVEEFGKDASEFTCNALTNAKSIYIEEESKSKTDKYGRSLGWIWYDGKLLQSELIKVGYAEVAYIYDEYKYTDSLCLDEIDAKENKFGIWNDEKREQKYCATINIEDILYNIDYSTILLEETDKNDSKNENKNYTISDAQNTIDNVTKIIDSNEDGIVNYLYYGIIILAVISIILKSRKK